MPTLLAPRYWPGHLGMLLALAAAIALGLWQYGAWGHHREDASRSLVHARPRALAEVMGPDSAFPGDDVGRPVRFSGEWLTDSTLYVRNRIHHGAKGYWVVTPVAVGSSAMPVVRGWSARPSTAPAKGPVDVTGWLQPSEDTGTPDADPADPVIASMAIASMTQHVDRDLYSAYVVASEATDGTAGLASIGPSTPPPVSRFTGLRNLLYALQWWVFGGFAVFVWVRWCRDEVEKVGSAA